MSSPSPDKLAKASSSYKKAVLLGVPVLIISVLCVGLFFRNQPKNEWKSALSRWGTGDARKRGDVINFIISHRRDLASKTRPQIIGLLGAPDRSKPSSLEYDFYSSSLLPMASFNGWLVVEFDGQGKVSLVYTDSNE